MKYIRRLLWFLATKMVMFTALIALLIIVFYLAMNTANAYILLSDGMKLRAHVNLTRTDESELSGYFTPGALLNDEYFMMCRSPESMYIDYGVTGFNHEITLEWMWSWPWQDTADARISDRVTRIAGSVLTERRESANRGEISATPPDYMNCRYDVKLVRIDGQWKIAGLIRKEYI